RLPAGGPGEGVGRQSLVHPAVPFRHRQVLDGRRVTDTDTDAHAHTHTDPDAHKHADDHTHTHPDAHGRDAHDHDTHEHAKESLHNKLTTFSSGSDRSGSSNSRGSRSASS